ncbi:metallophosphoesterase [Tautonia sp. JC769]|uniref:metallophosphoesterase family protein n=1 Tax=Tautonia sp. JC769 TaxID=3232135 RepID=UPI00345B30E9
MPIHVQALTRRGFLAGGAAAVAGLAVGRGAIGAEGDANRFALLSDTHIPSRPETEARGVNMTRNLQRVVGQLIALERKPAGVIVNGDCAYLKGLPEDYANFASCVGPMAGAGLDLHVTMGNHDDRGPLYDALVMQEPDRAVVESKHVSVIESEHANLFLLDTLTEVDVVTGELGREQLGWLAGELDRRGEKPAVLFAHHNPQFTPPEEGARWSGIRDTEAFFELIAARPQVKAYVYGHTHRWSIGKRDGLYLVNLPPVAYLFEEGLPNGWVDAQLGPGGMVLELRAMDPGHPQDGQGVALEWA